MKILSCHIENYGKLSNVDYRFNEGLTVFNHKNGSGKTTLSSFIKAMLYGLPSTKTNAKSFDHRQHFYPFDHSKFGGTVTIEHDGDEYRIERFFDSKSATADYVKVYKNDNIADDYGESLGKKLMGADEDIFMKTAFFNAEDISICTPQGIEAQVNNYEEGILAKKVLEEQSKKLQPQRGRNGKIPECQEKIRALREEIATLKESSSVMESFLSERSKKQKMLEEKEAKLRKNLVLESRLDERIAATGSRYQMNVLENMFIGGLPTAEDFERANGYINSIAEIEKQNEEIQKEFDVLLKKIKRRKMLITVNAFMIITAAVLLAVGDIIPSIILIAASGAMALFLCISGRKFKSAEKLSEERRKNILRYDFCVNELYEFIEAYKSTGNITDFAMEVQNIKNSAEAYLRISEIQNEMEKMGKEDSTFIEREIIEIKSEIALLDRQIAKLEAETEKIEEKQIDLEQTEAALEEYKEQLFVLDEAQNMLAVAENNLKNKYSDPIKENFGKYAEIIEETIGERFVLDDDYNVYFEAAGQRQSYKHLSHGQRSMLAFCFRMALIDSIYLKEKPFVILDDPFMSLDKENMAKMSSVIKAVSKDRQIIYFCCHESRDML